MLEDVFRWKWIAAAIKAELAVAALTEEPDSPAYHAFRKLLRREPVSGRERRAALNALSALREQDDRITFDDLAELINENNKRRRKKNER